MMMRDETRYQFEIDDLDAKSCEDHGLDVTYQDNIATVVCTEQQLQHALGFVS